MDERPASDEVVSSPQANYDALRNVSPETPCPYLPDRLSRSEAYYFDQIDGATYERLLCLGYRRSGRVVYKPRCRTCQECRQIRVRVSDFVARRSLTRVVRRNQDIRVEVGSSEVTDEKFALYRSYLDAQHDSAMARTFEAFGEFLCDSPTDTVEFRYLLGDRLVGVSIVDQVPRGLSSVYMYFDPDHGSRSLGTFSVLWEIDYCRRSAGEYYYLGYYVARSKTMAYKSRFRPSEVLVGDDRWVVLLET